MHEIANRIKETTFGQICQVPGEMIPTATDPPREALVDNVDFIVAYALHLLSVVAAKYAVRTTLEQYKQRSIEWYSVKQTAIPHIINGYYTASSFMHVVTGEFRNPSYLQQNRFSPLMTTVSNSCVGVTDGTYQHRCAQDTINPRNNHSMNLETIRKILCGRPPKETVWQGVYRTINNGEFESMESKVYGKLIMGVLANDLKYWLPNYNQTKHIVLPSPTPYSANELVAVPIERDQILHVNEDRRRRHAMGRLPPNSPVNPGKKQKYTNKTSKKSSDATIFLIATTRSIHTTLQPANIKSFMTPLRNATEQTAEVINIPTTDTAKLQNATNVDELESDHEPIEH
jgi:hypothetical protein